MTELTTGQRIAQCRKKLALSQEGLGEKVGVSRQAISKWEADATLPDIDKLIVLSRLFGASVGWLLGVEEQPEPQGESPQITEELLRKIEEIVHRSQPQKKHLSRGRKTLIALAGALLLWGALGLSREWQYTRQQVSYLTGQLQNSLQQNNSILNRLNTLNDRIDSINTTVQEASASLASFDFKIVPNIAEQYARVELTVFPKNWNEEWAATLNVRHDGALSLTQACHWDGSALNAALKLNFVDNLEYWLVIAYPDGTQESIPLEDVQAQNLKRGYTILYTGTPILSGYRSYDPGATVSLSIEVYGMHLRRPNPVENPGDWFWTRAEYVMYRTRDNVRTEVGISPILSPDEGKTDEIWGFSMTMPIEHPQEGDTYELWVMLELKNGVSHEECVGTWTFSNGEFVTLS